MVLLQSPRLEWRSFSRKSDLPTFPFASVLKSTAIYSLGWEVYQCVNTGWLQPHGKCSSSSQHPAMQGLCPCLKCTVPSHSRGQLQASITHGQQAETQMHRAHADLQSQAFFSSRVTSPIAREEEMGCGQQPGLIVQDQICVQPGTQASAVLAT